MATRWPTPRPTTTTPPRSTSPRCWTSWAVRSRIEAGGSMQRVMRIALATLAAALLLAAPATARLVTAPVGAPPRSDVAAARLVQRSDFEPRHDNDAANQRTPTAQQLKDFRAQ